MSELALIEIKPDQAAALYVENGLDAYLRQIRESVNEVPDLTTAKGRARIASLAASVSRSKTAVEKPGRDYLRHLKAQPKIIEAELRRFTTECDQIRDDVRRPLTEWEAEQERIKAEEAMNALHVEALEMNDDFDRQFSARIEADHELALLMNKDFDHQREQARIKAEQEQRDQEERLRRDAEDKARREVEEKHRLELEAAAQREADIQAKADAAERQRVEDEQRAAREKREAAERAEREKQDAISAERRRAEEAELARKATEQRKADEEARRAADKEHRRTINRQVIADLIAQGLPEEFAQKAMLAIAGGHVSNTFIKY